MVIASEIHQTLDRPKARIGRARFVLECIVALAFLKAGSSNPIVSTLALGAGFFIVFWLTEKRLRHIGRGDWWIVVFAVFVILVFIYGLFCVLYGIPRPDDTIKTNTMPIVIVNVIIPLLVVCLGFILVIWACVKRLRDIKQSAWWLAVLIVPVVGLTIYAMIDDFQRQLLPLTSNTFMRAVGTVWMVLYLLFVVALLFKASAFPKEIDSVPVLLPNLGAEKKDTVVNLSGKNIKGCMHTKRQMVSRTNQLNGWQRIGVVLSILWCFAVSGIAANDYYQAYSHYSDEVKAKSNSIACLERRASSPGQSTEPCLISEEDMTGIPNRKPQLPPILPLLAWLFLPVVLGWLLVRLALRGVKWVREGFKAK